MALSEAKGNAVGKGVLRLCHISSAAFGEGGTRGGCVETKKKKYSGVHPLGVYTNTTKLSKRRKEEKM